MRHGLGFFNAVFTMAIVTIILVWGVTSLTNSDPLWFLSSFDAQAETIVIYWDGTAITLGANDPGYADIMRAFSGAISKPVAFEWEVGLSEDSIHQYKQGNKLLEVQFSQPVQVHTRYPFNEAKTYLVPLDKSHALSHRIYAFTGIMPYTSGPVNASQNTFDALYTAVESAIAKN
ncbi:MAG: hypothetical protein E4H27_03930 [Anaerolineales bacterium]|nr:MAG: hypothetical protein E4H27_03930 [Anaerolineales bacterium]